MHNNKVRNTSLTISAMVAVIVEQLAEDYIEYILKIVNANNDFWLAIGSIVVYIAAFFIFAIVIQKLSNIKFIRTHIFKEKIVEGKWFEMVYTDPMRTVPFSCGFVDTYYTPVGELFYGGTDYDLKTLSILGQFYSICSSLSYLDNGSNAVLDYAYTYDELGKTIKGYGHINFFVGSSESLYHNGVYFDNEGTPYYFVAKLIKDKKALKIINNHSEGFNTVLANMIRDFIPDSAPSSLT